MTKAEQGSSDCPAARQSPALVVWELGSLPSCKLQEYYPKIYVGYRGFFCDTHLNWYWKCTPSFWLTYTFQIIIRTWRWGVSDQKMVCIWQEQDRFLCQVLFRFLKYLIWAGKEFKVKKDFQPWFAERKAHWSEPGSIRFPPNLDAHPWKSLKSRDFSSPISSPILFLSTTNHFLVTNT